MLSDFDMEAARNQIAVAIADQMTELPPKPKKRMITKRIVTRKMGGPKRMADSDFLDLVKEHLRKGNVSRDQLAEKLDVVPNYVSRKFRQLSGVTLTEWFDENVWLPKAKIYLHSMGLSPKDIAKKMDTDEDYLNAKLKRLIGLTVTQWRKEFNEKSCAHCRIQLNLPFSSYPVNSFSDPHI